MSKCLATQGVRCDFNHPLDSQHAELMKKYVLDNVYWRLHGNDYFLTVDKGILKKATDISAIKIINPIDFIIEWEAKL